MPCVRKEYTGLDLLRGVAAAAVVLHHLCQRDHAPHWFASGWLSVDIFFVMSGFVVAHAYDHRIDALGAYRFMRLRVIRFYPLYLVGLLLGVTRQGLLLATGSQEMSGLELLVSLALCLLFLPSPASGEAPALAPLDCPAWSLVLEVWINAAYAKLHRYATCLNLALVAAIGALLLLGLHVSGVELGDSRAAGFTRLLGSVARILYAFPIGVVLYRLRDRYDFARATGLIAVACAFAIMNLESLSRDWWGVACIVLVSPVVVATVSCLDVPRRLSEYCAVTSYFVYILHSPIEFIAIGAAHKAHIPELVPAALGVGSLFLIAPLADRLYDKPMRRLLKDLTWRRPAPGAPVLAGGLAEADRAALGEVAG